MRLIAILLIAATVVGCESSDESDYKPVEDISEEQGEESTEALPELMDTCQCDALTVDSAKVSYLKDRLFSGICYSMYPNSNNKYEEQVFLQGMVQSVKYYDKAGKLLAEEMYRDGLKLDNVNACDCNELEFIDRGDVKVGMLNSVQFTGRCRSYYPNSNQIYIEEVFAKGLRNGNTMMFDKNGEVLSVYLYEKGVLVKQRQY